ncbi:hypothetical protein, conserved [Eimeria praecox]|uniref:Uncharacterized protein n=1 Tax=Eimeria praecox TaxID=51316 RepID=U6G5G3_9EIME|nr:hypothetical protein, conserved [Eimeria praecox]
MVVHWGYSGSWLGKLLDAPTGAGEATQPGQEGADNADKVVGEDGISFQLKYRGKNVGLTKPLIIAIALIVVSGARYIMSKGSRPRAQSSQGLPLPVDDVSMQQYLNEFDEAAEDMKVAWRSSDVAVRKAFQLHFSPSLEDGKAPSAAPLATIIGHVDKTRKWEVPPHSSVEQRRDFAEHLHLLRNICRAVTLRLKELNWLALVSERADVPVPVPGLDEPYMYPDIDELEDDAESRSTAAEFLVSAGMFGSGSRQSVHAALADGMTHLLSIEKNHQSYNWVVRYFFERFLEPFGGANNLHTARPTVKYQIPYSGRAFRTGALSHAAEHIHRETDSHTSYTHIRKINLLLDNWTNTGVMEAMKQQEKENAHNFQKKLECKREQMKVLLRQGITRDDLEMSVLFLL